MLTTEVRESLNFFFQKPCRAIFSGSSQSGKTFLVGKILEEQKRLFEDEFVQISYYYERAEIKNFYLKFFFALSCLFSTFQQPTYLDEPPVDWHLRVAKSEVQYNCGFPKKDEVLSLPENSLLIIDDQADLCMKSDLIAQIFKGML